MGQSAVLEVTGDGGRVTSRETPPPVSSPTNTSLFHLQIQVCRPDLNTRVCRARFTHTHVLVDVRVGEATGVGAGRLVWVCLAGLRGCRTLQWSVGIESI